MKIKSLTIKELNIPFKVSFKHATATRSKTESVIVISETENGHKGYGEGCPRSYVTGETLETSFQFFNTHLPQLMGIGDLDRLVSWIAGHQGEIDQNPAAWCAIELALLDALGKENDQSMEVSLSLPQLDRDFQYTAVLGVNHLEGFKKQVQRYCELGFCDFKIKVSGNLKDDQDRIKLFESLNSGKSGIRLDANNLWGHSDEAIDYIEQLNYSFFAIEEPLKTGNYEGCRKIFEVTKIPIILDESFIRQDQFPELTSSPKAWMINLRISKMGGIVRSLAIAKQAEALGIPIIIGAQVGETSLLTRAALTVANATSNNVVAQEGAFGTHLLERDITSQPIMFGKGGKLSMAEFSQKPGLGIKITEDHLSSMTK